MKLRLRFWRKPDPTVPAEPAEPRNLDCKYCGPVDIGGTNAHQTPEDHLRSPEHRLAQAAALAAGTTPEPDEMP